MAVTNTKNLGPGTTNPSNDVEGWTQLFSADADTGTGAVSHNMGLTQLPKFLVTWLLGSAAITAAQLSLPWFATRSTTQWALSKATTAGSGNAAVQTQVYIERIR